MKVHEYQGKEILARYGVPVPRGILITDAGEARAAAEKLGGRLRISGLIARYRGQRYLLLRKVMPERDLGQFGN